MWLISGGEVAALEYSWNSNVWERNVPLARANEPDDNRAPNVTVITIVAH